jgi:hypothetical protein
MISAITPLPTWEKVLAVAELYLLYCESQPFPLFHRDSFLSSLSTRDPEILYAVLALSIRFSDEDCQGSNDLATLVSGYTEVARGLVMRRVSEGPVELSTLQCLCLLSLIDFTSKPSLLESTAFESNPVQTATHIAQAFTVALR